MVVWLCGGAVELSARRRGRNFLIDSHTLHPPLPSPTASTIWQTNSAPSSNSKRSKRATSASAQPTPQNTNGRPSSPHTYYNKTSLNSILLITLRSISNKSNPARAWAAIKPNCDLIDSSHVTDVCQWEPFIGRHHACVHSTARKSSQLPRSLAFDERYPP